MAKKNGQIGIRADDELVDYVNGRAEADGVSASEVVRQALVEQQARRGPTERADDILERLCNAQPVSDEEIIEVEMSLPVSERLAFFEARHTAAAAAARWLQNRVR